MKGKLGFSLRRKSHDDLLDDKDSKGKKSGSKTTGGYEGDNPVNNLRSLEEALLSLADEPGTVARSTPQNLRRCLTARPDLEAASARSTAREASSVLSPDVTDGMLAAGLARLDQLQDSLDAYIDEVRSAPTTVAAPSPVPPSVPLSTPLPSGHPALPRSHEHPSLSTRLPATNPSLTTPLTVQAEGLTAALPPSDSGHGTSLDGNESLSPIPGGNQPQPSFDSLPGGHDSYLAAPTTNGHARSASPAIKSVSFKNGGEAELPPPLPMPSNKRRVIRMVNF